MDSVAKGPWDFSPPYCLPHFGKLIPGLGRRLACGLCDHYCMILRVDAEAVEEAVVIEVLGAYDVMFTTGLDLSDD